MLVKFTKLFKEYNTLDADFKFNKSNYSLINFNIYYELISKLDSTKIFIFK